MENLREKANNLPLKPGVYIMMDKTGAVIYVGKAKKLKNRVSSYFRENLDDPKTAAMVSKVGDFDVIVADTEFEALVLENSLIKRHLPKYNILLKDDKGFPFIRLGVGTEYPVFSIVGKRENDGARYFGPCAGRNTAREALDAVCKALKLPTCKKKFPRDIGKDRPCLNYHMGVCAAYCQAGASAADYGRSIDQAVMILEGKTGELLGRLEEEMRLAAEELRFEQAAALRDRHRAVEKLGEKQKIVSGTPFDADAVGFCRDESRSCFVVLHYIGGVLLDKDYELADVPIESDGEAVSELVRQYYLGGGVYPREILLPGEPEDLDSLERLFSENAGYRVYIETPKRGEKQKLVALACENAQEELKRVSSREEKLTKTMEWLARALRLPNPPRRIEAYDVSNTGSSDMVASMTVHVDGRPLKRAYRRFKIKRQEGQDDCRAVAEVIDRRLGRLEEGDEGFVELPDLFLIDGGSRQAASAKEVLDRHGVAVPVFGMVKDDRHRTRALAEPGGGEIGIVAFPAAFSMIGRIQEETHRFAIEYHRKLRSKKTAGSTLDRIGGVGDKRKSALLKHFKSIRAISEATPEELAAVVPKNTAAAVYGYFHGKRDAGEQGGAHE